MADRSTRTKVYHIAYHSGLRAAVLHFHGCNFNCRGCLRRALAYDCHLGPNYPRDREGELSFLTVGQVVDLLAEVGPKEVVFEGWEPTVDPALADLARAVGESLRPKPYRVLLTNGRLMPPLGAFEEIKFSIKAVTDSIHIAYTGVSNADTLRNFVKCYEAGENLSAETVLIPGLVDVDEVERIAEFIASVDPSIPLRIDAYWPCVEGLPWRAPTEEELRAAVAAARRHLRNVSRLSKGNSVIGEVICLWPR